MVGNFSKVYVGMLGDSFLKDFFRLCSEIRYKSSTTSSIKYLRIFIKFTLVYK